MIRPLTPSLLCFSSLSLFLSLSHTLAWVSFLLMPWLLCALNFFGLILNPPMIIDVWLTTQRRRHPPKISTFTLKSRCNCLSLAKFIPSNSCWGHKFDNCWKRTILELMGGGGGQTKPGFRSLKLRHDNNHFITSELKWAVVKNVGIKNRERSQWLGGWVRGLCYYNFQTGKTIIKREKEGHFVCVCLQVRMSVEEIESHL